MAKTSKGKAEEAVRAERNRSLNQATQFTNEIAAERPTLRSRADEERSNLYSRWNNMVDTGGLMPGSADRLRGITGPYTWENGDTGSGGGSSNFGGGDSGGSGGGFSQINQPPKPALFEAPYAGFSEFANTGGVDLGKLEESAGIFRDMAGKQGGFSTERLNRLNDTVGNLNAIGKTGGYSDETLNRVRGGINFLNEIGKTGGYNPDVVSRIRGDISNIRGLAGQMQVDPALRANINSGIEGYRGFANTGGIDPENINRMRGMGVFDNFANTGGFSSGDINNIRSRSNAVLPAMRQAQLADLERLNTIQGGAGGSTAAAIAKMSRGNSQAMADAARDTELGISDRVRQGKQWGASSLSDAEGRLQSLLSSNKLAGNEGLVRASSNLAGLDMDAINRRAGILGEAARGEADLEGNLVSNRLAGLQAGISADRGLEDALISNRFRGMGDAANIDLSTQEQIDRSRQGAASGIQKTMADAQGLVQSGRQFGLQGMMTVEQARQQAAEQEAARNAAAASARYAADRDFEARRAADVQANRNLASQNERFLIEAYQNGMTTGMGGLQGLYGSTPGELSFNDKLRAGLIDSTAGNINSNLQTQIGAASLPGAMDKAMGYVGMGAGIAAPFFGGGAPRIGNTGVTGAGSRVTLDWMR